MSKNKSVKDKGTKTGKKMGGTESGMKEGRYSTTPKAKSSNFRRNIILWILVITSALLLSIPFLVPGMGMISLVGFVPLLAAEHIAYTTSKRFFSLHYYTAFLLWNFITTYWIYNATLPGMIAAVVLNALQMAVIFRLFRFMKRVADGFLPYLFLVFAWVAWEQAYFNWEVSWPWLVLGNSFATSIKSIQWYEYTGTVGGSLWILLINVLLFRTLQLISQRERITATAALLLPLFALPVILSHIIFYSYEERPCEPAWSGAGSREFIVLQPNIDPYRDKFSRLNQSQQNRVLLTLASEALSDYPVQTDTLQNLSEQIYGAKEIGERNRDLPNIEGKESKESKECKGTIENKESKESLFIVAPETFLSSYPLVSESNPLQNRGFDEIFRFVERYNLQAQQNGGDYSLNMIVGAVTENYYPFTSRFGRAGGASLTEAPTPTARFNRSAGCWFDRSNSAIFIGSNGECEFYHKSKLVVLVESTPYKKLLNFMSRFSIDLGGAMGSYAPQKEREVFTTPDSVRIGTAICYESVYGNFYREYILKGAQVMSIITNDGWWGDTPGYRQHLSYASLRAIETRRSIARSANTGISALINQRGEIISSTEWWKAESLAGRLNLNDEITIFVKYGDIAGRISQFLFFLFLLMAVARVLSRKTRLK